jgi:hypothetical protein
MKKEAEIKETLDETLETIRKSGLGVALIDPSSEEAKDHCAYQSCKEAVVLTVETLPVCQKHAISLMHCFIPDCKPKAT